MARRSEHSKAQLTEMILVATEEIVDEQGYSGISARKIATKIAYTVGTLYIVFDNLDDLVLHVNARTLDQLYKEMKQATNDCNHPRACINKLAHTYVAFATQNPQRWSMVFEHRLPDSVNMPEWFSGKVNEMFKMVESQLQPLVETYSESDIEQLSRTIWCGVHGICSLAITQKLFVESADDIQQLTDLLVNNFMSGVTMLNPTVNSKDMDTKNTDKGEQ